MSVVSQEVEKTYSLHCSIDANLFSSSYRSQLGSRYFSSLFYLLCCLEQFFFQNKSDWLWTPTNFWREKKNAVCRSFQLSCEVIDTYIFTLNPTWLSILFLDHACGAVSFALSFMQIQLFRISKKKWAVIHNKTAAISSRTIFMASKASEGP